MQKLLLRALILCAGIALAACGGGGGGKIEPAVESASQGALGEDEISVSGLGDGDDVSGVTGLDDADLQAKRIIYFDYDSSALTPGGEAIVRAHARYLASSSATIVLEGHADERGTREYNLALGEDRARAVANVLQILGVPGARIQSVSYGEERPVALGSDESAWNLNRRVEILYQE